MQSEPRPRSSPAARSHSMRPSGWEPSDWLRLDSDLRLVLELIEGHNWPELASRTGIVVLDAKVVRNAPPAQLPLVIELADLVELKWTSLNVREQLEPLRVRAIPAVYREIDRTGQRLRRLPATLAVSPYDPSQIMDDPGAQHDGDATLLDRLREILSQPCVLRIALSGQHLPTLKNEGPIEDMAHDLRIPADRLFKPASRPKSVKPKPVTGRGVVIGIVDDGCPLAHHDFLTPTGPANKRRYHTRFKRLWDQTDGPSAQDLAHGWTEAPDYGREIDDTAIEAAVNQFVTGPHSLDEQAVYDYLDYPREGVDLASHGGRVAGIAAGNGRSLTGTPGVAPEADLVFVQLPKVAVDLNPATLDKYVSDAIAYIFDYAAAAGKSAVVNVSYGGYSGAHDGTGDVETAIDAHTGPGMNGRLVVVSAGNGFEADCHAYARLQPGEGIGKRWITLPDDRSSNDLEIWYPGNGALDITLIAPDGTSYGPFALGTSDFYLPDPTAPARFGMIDHVTIGTNNRNRAFVTLFATVTDAPVTGYAAPPAGTWTVGLHNVGTTPVDAHAWIRRDDVGTAIERRVQSRFAPDDAHPGHTIADYATGKYSISVGAYNRATLEIGSYSAAGPAISSVAPKKPLVMAVGESLPHGRGVASTATGRGLPMRLAGTSAAAPRVTGLLALALQAAGQWGVQLDAPAVITALSKLATGIVLEPNRHQAASTYPTVKQKDILADVIGYGAVDWSVMDALLP
ncbi:MAG: S8 family serine peptidase [Burkholderiales bacterium]